MKKLITIISIVLFLSSCNDFLDINENPNFPTDVSDELLLTSAQAAVTNVYCADWGLIGSFWSQHWAQNNTSSQYKIYETYAISSNTNVIERSYRAMFVDGLSDNEIFLKKVAESENWGAYLMGAVIKAYGFQYLVDLYGNVPYTEAFLGSEKLNPVIDKGENIYADIYALLVDALDKDFSSFVPELYEANDIIFEGDLEAWQAFANSLRLRILLRQYDANSSFANTEIAKLIADMEAEHIYLLDRDVAVTNFEDADSKSNPLYESDQRQLNTTNNIKACVTFTSYLEANSDPRLEVLFTPIDGKYLGMVPGSYNVPSTEFEAPKLIASPVIEATMPVYWMTYAESELLIAEAYLRLGNTEMAQAYYESGVSESFDRMEADAGDLLTGAYAFPATGFNDQLKAIIVQKWIDAAEGGRGIESHIERVRTGYPEESTISDQIDEGYTVPGNYIPGTLIYSKKGTTSGILPRRFPYPDSELNFNSNAAEYKALVDADVILQKVWWKN
ncbi:SusD/RagB family nutrient-binding outer membrane lipoprotein [Maribellus sp. CM-23]|uniref:SusD/RagB family nutrient-binding outer membrane lipoprotein n=1 Tax=Maribellus sp. CM-23 TaxID=2781026 RepID=UPI001F328C09|nr:SusD/RagB family nutrient-binding outer membrane lipoprotein [Maribellus sp. CM-23]MCE4563116.1 SusD/RagB family nutrient-binding outer membrane lipoprotein [Maribellus sp. CM-23]